MSDYFIKVVHKKTGAVQGFHAQDHGSYYLYLKDSGEKKLIAEKEFKKEYCDPKLSLIMNGFDFSRLQHYFSTRVKILSVHDRVSTAFGMLDGIRQGFIDEIEKAQEREKYEKKKLKKVDEEINELKKFLLNNKGLSTQK